MTAGRAEAFGLIIDRPARTLGSEVFFMQLISGIQDELARQHVTLLFTMVEDQDEEIEIYRRWWAQRRVDGVFVVDLQVNDRRIALLEGLRMPAVVIGTPRGSGTLPAVWQDDRSAVDTLVTYLAELGHQRIARVGGFARYWHSRLRSEEFTSAAAAAGLTAVSVEADYSAEHGARTTRSLLGSAEPPTAIVYDNDVMAAAGLGAAQRMGRNMQADVDLVLGRLGALRADPPGDHRAAQEHPGRGQPGGPDAPGDGRRRLPGELPGGPARPDCPRQLRPGRRPGDRHPSPLRLTLRLTAPVHGPDI